MSELPAELSGKAKKASVGKMNKWTGLIDYNDGSGLHTFPDGSKVSGVN